MSLEHHSCFSASLLCTPFSGTLWTVGSSNTGALVRAEQTQTSRKAAYTAAQMDQISRNALISLHTMNLCEQPAVTAQLSTTKVLLFTLCQSHSLCLFFFHYDARGQSHNCFQLLTVWQGTQVRVGEPEPWLLHLSYFSKHKWVKGAENMKWQRSYDCQAQRNQRTELLIIMWECSYHWYHHPTEPKTPTHVFLPRDFWSSRNIGLSIRGSSPDESHRLSLSLQNKSTWFHSNKGLGL